MDDSMLLVTLLSVAALAVIGGLMVTIVLLLIEGALYVWERKPRKVKAWHKINNKIK